MANRCQSCGMENRDDAKFCKGCGTSIAAAAPQRNEFPLSAVACPACGHSNRPESKFCAKCGTVLGQPVPQRPSIVVPVTPPTATAPRETLAPQPRVAAEPRSSQNDLRPQPPTPAPQSAAKLTPMPMQPAAPAEPPAPRGDKSAAPRSQVGIATGRHKVIVLGVAAFLGIVFLAGGGFWIWEKKQESDTRARQLEEARIEQARQKDLETRRRDIELTQRLKAEEEARQLAEKARLEAEARAAAEAQAKREAESRALAQTRAAEETKRAAKKAQREAAEQQRRSASARPTPGPQASGYAAAAEAARRGDNRGAVAACKPAADAGDAQCMNLMGTLYASGEVGNRSELELRIAAELVRRAAVQGLPAAQYNFGSMNERGTGVRQDLGAALSWYRKAASQGQPDAQKAVDRLSAQGAAQGGTTPPSAQPVTRTAKELCANRANFISRGICESRECQKSEHQEEALCKQMKASEESRRQSQQ